MNFVDTNERDNKEYTVVIAYASFDSHGDKGAAGNAFDEPDVYKVNVHAVTNIQAITYAMHIVTCIKAEIMTDFFTNHPMTQHQDSFTIEEIEHMRHDAEGRGIFKDWLAMEPTSIQCHLTIDEPKLLDMSANNINQMHKDVADGAEEFLRNKDE
tara:strand:+ start:1638 stop:2102 length:465 start_codon:yes stop_codon:yes gene_type:complete